jgi:hypothetical protein
MMYNAERLTRILGTAMSAVMVMGIVVLILYTALYDKRDPEICVKFGGIPTVIEGKPGCDMGEEV